MMVATRFGLRFEALAHPEIESAQCWTSILKIGEIPLGLESGGASAGIGKGLVFHARDASIALINMTASGTITAICRPDKQPLP